MDFSIPMPIPDISSLDSNINLQKFHFDLLIPFEFFDYLNDNNEIFKTFKIMNLSKFHTKFVKKCQVSDNFFNFKICDSFGTLLGDLDELIEVLFK